MLPTGTPATPSADVALRTSVGTYPTYEQAREAVRFLAGNDFPVQRVSIVGADLRTVETIMGRLTRARAAGAGAVTGAWFGLLAGLLLGLITPGAVLPAMAVGGLLYGAVFGALFALGTRLATRGRGDLVSCSTIVADRYEVLTDHAVAEDARNLLIKHGWRTT
ncbi:general stress protein [Nonomuraea sp. NPDC047897]|uniref:general stress protein n=1 Tax=Nonomuraea sp. NPDC047897 TaxID=3364346 RepID=UPI00371C2F82